MSSSENIKPFRETSGKGSFGYRDRQIASGEDDKGTTR